MDGLVSKVAKLLKITVMLHLSEVIQNGCHLGY